MDWLDMVIIIFGSVGLFSLGYLSLHSLSRYRQSKAKEREERVKMFEEALRKGRATKGACRR